VKWAPTLSFKLDVERNHDVVVVNYHNDDRTLLCWCGRVFTLLL
jgi:hypothetical protein